MSIVLFLRGKREKRPRYTVRTFRLVEDRLRRVEGVEIKYEGKLVSNLSVSRIAVWNDGRSPIDAADVAPKDPVRIKLVDGIQLLGANVVLATNEINNFRLTPSLQTSEIAIEFDYFSCGEGIVVEVFHTGKQNSEVNVLGTIKGVDRFLRVDPDRDPITDSIFGRLFTKLPDPGRLPAPLAFVYILLVGIPLAPFVWLTMVPDKFLKLFRRVPAKLSLDNIRRDGAA